MRDSKRDTDVQNSLMDSVGEGEGGMIYLLFIWLLHVLVAARGLQSLLWRSIQDLQWLLAGSQLQHANSQLQHVGSSSLIRDDNLGPLHWELRVLAPGPPWKSQNQLLVSLIFVFAFFVSISFISALIFIISFLLLTLDFVCSSFSSCFRCKYTLFI